MSVAQPVTGSLTTVQSRVRDLLQQVDAAIDGPLDEAAELVLGAIQKGGLVLAAGAGHSLAMVCETFYRAGGLACVRPIWHDSIFPLPDAAGSTASERVPGIGLAVIRDAQPTPDDVVVVFSTSGRNPYPVEIAREALDQGIGVIAVTSPAASATAVARSGATLADTATVVLDTAVPAGDVVTPASQPRTAAVSTLSAAYVWGRLLERVDQLATERGIELPRWRSANTPGGDQVNVALFEQYSARIPELGSPAK